MIDNIHISEENKMASYTALWNEMIDIEENRFGYWMLLRTRTNSNSFGY